MRIVILLIIRPCLGNAAPVNPAEQELVCPIPTTLSIWMHNCVAVNLPGADHTLLLPIQSMTGAYGVRLARRGPGRWATAPCEVQGNLTAHTEFVTCDNTIEYGFKQIKNELGWADHRLTDYRAIERWWELVFSAYLMVGFQMSVFAAADDHAVMVTSPARRHAWWDDGLAGNTRSTISAY